MSKVLLITGPAGAGKTTTCEELASSADGVWAFISQDHVRTFIKKGFKNPAATWDEETEKQWEVSQAICGDILRRYQAAGINCVIDCFAPKGSFDKWEEVLGGIEYKLVVLLPNVDETVRRNKERTGDRRLKESQIREHHEWFSVWKNDEQAELLDTSTLTTQEVVTKVLKLNS